VDRNSLDPGPRFGRKSKKKGYYGYKANIVEDSDSELIVGVKTTPGNVPDGAVFPELIGAHPRETTGDKVDDSPANHAHLAELGVASGIIRRQRPPGCPRNSRRERPKIERKFAEGKQNHGMKKARYRGLAKVSIQNLMVALVANLKCLVKLLLPGQAKPRLALAA
jgi:IS5 family transposase